MLLSEITSLGKTVLLIAAITFIAWAIVTAIFVPRRNPKFPRRLDAYILVSALLFIAQMTAVVWVTGTQEVEEAHASEEAGEPGGTTGEPEGAGATPRPARRCSRAPGARRVTRWPTRARAARSGRTSTRRSPGDAGRRARDERGGRHAPFKDQLSEKQIADVAAYVSSVAGTS